LDDVVLSNPQNQNDVELIMLIMKSIEDKNIQGIKERINFVDTFKVSDEIKNVAKSYIRQNISYSDNKKNWLWSLLIYKM
jgi:predicted CoA-binding protein